MSDQYKQQVETTNLAYGTKSNFVAQQRQKIMSLRPMSHDIEKTLPSYTRPVSTNSHSRNTSTTPASSSTSSNPSRSVSQPLPGLHHVPATPSAPSSSSSSSSPDPDDNQSIFRRITTSHAISQGVGNVTQMLSRTSTRIGSGIRSSIQSYGETKEQPKTSTQKGKNKVIQPEVDKQNSTSYTTNISYEKQHVVDDKQDEGGKDGKSKGSNVVRLTDMKLTDIKTAVGDKVFRRDLSRVPFTLWVWMLGFLIVRLFVIANDISHDSGEFKQFITNSCLVVESSTNDVIGLQKATVLDMVDTIAVIADSSMSIGMKALFSTADLSCELVMVIIEVITGVLRCVPVAAVELATEAIISAIPSMESTATSSLDNTINAANNAINNINNQINAVINQLVGPVDDAIGSYNFFVNPSVYLTLPPTIANIPNIQTPSISFPPITPNFGLPDFSSIEADLIADVNPQAYLDAQLDKIKTYNVTATELINKLGLQSKLVITNLTFCSGINFTTFDILSNTLLASVYGAAACLIVIMVILLLVEVFIITLKYKKYNFVPNWISNSAVMKSWLNKNGELTTVFKHIWYKPSVSCLCVGIIGILVFTVLEVELTKAKTEFDMKVVAEIRTYVDGKLYDLDSDLSVISSNFANTVNAELHNLTVTIDMLRNDINNTLNDIVEYQAVAQNWLNANVGTINPIAGPALVTMIECLVLFLRLPLADILNLVPNFNGFATVNSDVLMFNLTHAQAIVNSTLEYTSTYPFDYYITMAQSDRIFYYFLTGYGVPVMLFGLVAASWHIYQDRKERKTKTIQSELLSSSPPTVPVSV